MPVAPPRHRFRLLAAAALLCVVQPALARDVCVPVAAAAGYRAGDFEAVVDVTEGCGSSPASWDVVEALGLRYRALEVLRLSTEQARAAAEAERALVELTECCNWESECIESGEDGRELLVALALSYLGIDQVESDCQVELREAPRNLLSGDFSRALEWIQICLDQPEVKRATRVRAYELEAIALTYRKPLPGAESAVEELVCLDPEFVSRDPLASGVFRQILATKKRTHPMPRTLNEIRAACPPCARPTPGPNPPVDWEPDDRRWEIGLVGGFFLPDRALSNKPESFRDIESLAGVRATAFVAPRWAVTADALLSDINTNLPQGDADTRSLRAGAEWFFSGDRGTSAARRPRSWFLSMGGGWVRYAFETAGEPERSFASIGIGRLRRLDKRARVRWEIRGDQTLDDDGAEEPVMLRDKEITTFQFLLSVTWLVGQPVRY